MAKVGYIFNVPHYEGIDKDKAWMMDYGCVNIIEESSDMEAIRPGWKLLMANLERGDELILSKFSNAIRNLSELAFLLETCRIKVIRVISINDKIDSKGKLFPDTTVPQVLNMFGAIPEETAVPCKNRQTKSSTCFRDHQPVRRSGRRTGRFPALSEPALLHAL